MDAQEQESSSGVKVPTLEGVTKSGAKSAVSTKGSDQDNITSRISIDHPALGDENVRKRFQNLSQQLLNTVVSDNQQQLSKARLQHVKLQRKLALLKARRELLIMRRNKVDARPVEIENRSTEIADQMERVGSEEEKLEGMQAEVAKLKEVLLSLQPVGREGLVNDV